MRIKTILDKYGIDYRFLKETKDIWCRDYMPVQISEKDFIQFRYDPSYLKTIEDLKTKSDPRLINLANGFQPMHSAINLDGGNVVRYKEKVLITSRVYKENRDLGLTDEQLLEKLKKDLKAHVIIIPEHRGDEIDHADGEVRFHNYNTILVNALDEEYKYWKVGMRKMIAEQDFNMKEVPWFRYRNKKKPLSAIGIYINYLEVANLILLPKFGIAGNRDQEAYQRFKELFPKRDIEQVNINAIAEEGGLLNCIT